MRIKSHIGLKNTRITKKNSIKHLQHIYILKMITSYLN